MLPYVTASQVEKISREVAKESGSAPFIITGTPSMEDETLALYVIKPMVK